MNSSFSQPAPLLRIVKASQATGFMLPEDWFLRLEERPGGAPPEGLGSHYVLEDDYTRDTWGSVFIVDVLALQERGDVVDVRELALRYLQTEARKLRVAQISYFERRTEGRKLIMRKCEGEFDPKLIEVTPHLPGHPLPALLRRMRDAQKEWLKFRGHLQLKTAQDLEKEVDAALRDADALFTPARQPQPVQTALF